MIKAVFVNFVGYWTGKFTGGIRGMQKNLPTNLLNAFVKLRVWGAVFCISSTWLCSWSSLLFIRAHQRSQSWLSTISVIFIEGMWCSQYSNRRVWSVRFLPLLSNVHYWVKTPRNVSAAEQQPWIFISALNKTESLVEVRKKKRILEIKCLSCQSQMEDLYSLLINKWIIHVNSSLSFQWQKSMFSSSTFPPYRKAVGR